MTAGAAATALPQMAMAADGVDLDMGFSFAVGWHMSQTSCSMTVQNQCGLLVGSKYQEALDCLGLFLVTPFTNVFFVLLYMHRLLWLLNSHVLSLFHKAPRSPCQPLLDAQTIWAFLILPHYGRKCTTRIRMHQLCGICSMRNEKVCLASLCFLWKFLKRLQVESMMLGIVLGTAKPQAQRFTLRWRRHPTSFLFPIPLPNQDPNDHYFWKGLKPKSTLYCPLLLFSLFMFIPFAASIRFQSRSLACSSPRGCSLVPMGLVF